MEKGKNKIYFLNHLQNTQNLRMKNVNCPVLNMQ